MATTPDRAIELACPAKVNLALSVGPPRPSDGMHPIASWMVALRFGDTLRLARAADTTFDIRFADDAPVPQPVDWPLEKDLAVRAHALVQQHVGRELPVAAALVKRIPTGAGLGGGSSDAAAVIVGLDRLFRLHLSRAAQLGLAARLGSDVPFFVGVHRGDPSAIVHGVGEHLEPAPLARTLHLVLALPGPALACPTGPVYRAFDELVAGEDRTSKIEERNGQPRPPTPDPRPPTPDPRPLTPDPQPDPPAFLGQLPGVRALAARAAASVEAGSPPELPGMFNDLTEPAFRVQPPLRDLRRRLAAVWLRGESAVHVSGSGSTLFTLARDPAAAAALAAAATPLVPCVATHTL